ncbi:zinc knuckle (CCHC-type) family protein [Euphorbia peplus]|nr:zinc knuckle (CCHC-type) family protein [Euphorbia peplus]
MEASKSAPTGCYKCGRPGHWSRDCPDSNPNPNPNPDSNFNSESNHHPTNLNSSRSTPFNPNNNNVNSKAAVEKPKKLPRTRPKLTPEVLLGDDGLGYVLRHFPANFKFRGRGHEVADLGNLIRLYTQWHSRLLPYYSFDQFVHKVEQVAATKRVKICLRDLRERVASGVDPTKLHESQAEHLSPIRDEDHIASGEAGGLHVEGGPSTWSNDDVIQEDMLHDVFDTATQEPSQTLHNGLEKPAGNYINCSSSEIMLTDEQRDRTESNRAKALERAAVPSMSNEVMITDEQRARIEANRLKALERAAARSRASQ